MYKFRGWHTGQRRMYSAEEMTRDQLTLLPTGEFINVSGVSTSLSVIYPRDKFIPLLYTGFLDRNSKESYEGDIANCVVMVGSIGKIFYKDGAFWWGGNVIGYCEHPLHLTSSNCEQSGWIPYEYEVIGNSYENPELLDDNHR